MRLRYIEIFHAVMQAGTVKGAAELLHITQPAASRLLQQAEANLGTPLFQRDRGRLLPTQEAIILRPEIEQLHARLDEVRRIATTLADGEDVSLKVLSEPALAVEFLPAACARLMRRKPRLKLTVHTLHTRQLCESLALREAHIGFAFAPSSHPAIASSPVAEAELVCVGLDLPDGPMSLEQAVSGPVVDLAPDDEGSGRRPAQCGQAREHRRRVHRMRVETRVRREVFVVGLEHVHRAGRTAVGQRVDENEGGALLEQVVGQVHAADAVVGDRDAWP